MMTTSLELNHACRLAQRELKGTALKGQPLGAAPISVSARSPQRLHCSASFEEEPLLLRAAKQQPVERPPAWMMRQAGRYMKAYQDLTKRHPSFRERSETTDLIVDITLQPWRAFRPDGVILFSDILTPLDAMGIPFEIDENKGPVVDKPIRSDGDFGCLHSIDLDKLHFVSESLGILRREIGKTATLLGFVGAPWTLATYCVEGGSTRTYTVIKSMKYSAPEVLGRILSFLAEQIGEYAKFQIEAGAQVVQVFDSWGGQLTPEDWEVWSKPYIQQVISSVKAAHPDVPVVLYAYGSSGLLERMSTVGADVIGLDWHVDMAEGRQRVGAHMAVQGNVDPAVLYASPEAISEAINRCVTKAGPVGHILNLGHGVLPGTPEANVAHFFSTVQSLSYAGHDLKQPEVAGASR